VSRYIAGHHYRGWYMSKAQCLTTNQLISFLSRKLVIINAVILLVVILVIGFFWGHGVRRSFEELQSVEVEKQAHMVRVLIDDQRERLGELSIDYSQWSATYNFMAERNQAYLDETFETFHYDQLRLNYIALLDADGMVVWTGGKTKDESPYVDPISSEFWAKKEMDLYDFEDGSDFNTGILCTRYGPMLTAISQVIEGKDSNTCRGFVVFGALLKDFPHRVLSSLESKTYFSDCSADQKIVEGSNLSVQQVFDSGLFLLPARNNSVTAFFAMESLQPEQFLVARLDTPLNMTTRGSDILENMFFVVVVVMVISVVVLFYVFKRSIFTPLSSSLEHTLGLLQERERELTSILNSIPDIIYYKDPNGKYIGGNSAFQEYVGKYSRELIGLTDYDFFEQDIAKSNQIKDMEVMCSCMLSVTEEVIKFPCGVTLQLEMIKAPYFDEKGGMVGLIGIGRDIAERKALEESLVEARNKAERATRARSEFLANMSHEIRTPMNGVVTMAEMICDQQLSHKAEECAVTIRDSSKILLGELNDILDFSKIEEGKLDVNIQPFPCMKMVKEVVALYSNRADAKGIVLTYNYSDTAPQYASGDELRIRQVLGNIISNAIKFCPEGAVEIEVYKDRDKWFFKVSDTGIGMTEDQISRVFDKFEQANSSITQRFGGTGLGLSISKKLVELMGGELHVESEFGAGTVFTAILPLGEADVDDVVVEIISRDDDVNINARVLLADDNRFNNSHFGFHFEAESLYDPSSLSDLRIFCSKTAQLSLVFRRNSLNMSNIRLISAKNRRCWNCFSRRIPKSDRLLAQGNAPMSLT